VSGRNVECIPDSTGHPMYIHLMSSLGPHVHGHEWNIIRMSIRGHRIIYIIYVNPMDVHCRFVAGLPLVAIDRTSYEYPFLDIKQIFDVRYPMDVQFRLILGRPCNL